MTEYIRQFCSKSNKCYIKHDEVGNLFIYDIKGNDMTEELMGLSETKFPDINAIIIKTNYTVMVCEKN